MASLAIVVRSLAVYHQNEERKNWEVARQGKIPPFATSREGWGIRTERKVKDNVAKTI